MRCRQVIGSWGGWRARRWRPWAWLALSPALGAAIAPPPPAATEIVLSGSPAAAPVLAAVLADLRRTPLRHVVSPAPCTDAGACEAWLAAVRAPGSAPGSTPGPGAGFSADDRILAVLDLDLTPSGGAFLRATPVQSGDQWVFPEGWLVHAVLRSADAVGRPLAFAEARHPFLAQLVWRAATPGAASGSGGRTGPFLRRGTPAIGLVAPPYEAAALLAATVRRLDRLPDRPVAEDTYLVAFGRVWLRRDLYWLGFLLWVLLVLRGRPGRWQGTGPEERRRRGRAYRPGFAFRLLFLAAVFLSPILAVLLFPAGLLALVPPRRRLQRWLWAGLSLLLAAVFAGAFGLALARHQIAGWGAGPLAALLPLAALAAYVNWLRSLPIGST